MSFARPPVLLVLLLCAPIALVSHFPLPSGDIGAIGRVTQRIDRMLADLATVTCREEVHRYTGTLKWSRAKDVVSMLVDDVNGIESYSMIQKLNLDGTPRGHRQYPNIPALRGSYSYGELYSVLKTTSQALTSNRADTAALVDPGSGLLRIAFRCVGECWLLRANARMFWANTDGEVKADAETGELRELSWVSSGLPVESGVDSLELKVSYRPTEIAGETRVVPVDAFYRVTYVHRKRMDWNMTSFSDYRRFGSETSVSFGQ